MRQLGDAKDLEIIFALTLFGGVIVAGSLAYDILAFVSCCVRLAHPATELEPEIGISVLKPLYGATPETYSCLESFCHQSHRKYQLLFGVADEHDPAVALVDRLRIAFPQRDICLVVDRRQHGTNRKVSNLVNMIAMARHEYLVISDSDVRVAVNYLSTVAAPLRDQLVGIVTCAYQAVAVRGAWSRIGAMFINEWFVPSVRVAALLGSRQFAFGATIAIRRETLAAIGGFEAIADQLADDYRLGQLTRQIGRRTVLSPLQVDVVVDDNSLVNLALHEMRWLRTIRAVRPLSYTLAFVSLGLPAAAIGALLSDSSWGVGALGACVLLRIALHFRTRRGRSPWHDLLLLPVRDSMNLMFWLAAFLTRQVRWREREYVVQRDGSLLPVEASAVP